MSIIDDDVRHDMQLHPEDNPMNDMPLHPRDSDAEFSTRVRPVKKATAQSSHLTEFTGQMKRRLERGEKKYGDKSFLTDNTFTDMKEELLDVANYAYLMYERITRLEQGEMASDYLNLCTAVDITNESEPEKSALEAIFKKYNVCHRVDGREFHYCKKETE